MNKTQFLIGLALRQHKTLTKSYIKKYYKEIEGKACPKIYINELINSIINFKYEDTQIKEIKIAILTDMSKLMPNCQSIDLLNRRINFKNHMEKK